MGLSESSYYYKPKKSPDNKLQQDLELKNDIEEIQLKYPRKQWAKKRGAKIVSFEKYDFSKNKFGVENQKTGFTYTTKFLGEVKEISTFTICKDKSLIHSKALLFKEHYSEEKI